MFAAYMLADILSGLYHWATDKGYNLKFQVEFFQEHHRNPKSMTFDYQPIAGAIPLAIIAYFIWPWFFGSLAFFILCIQIPHYYTHHPENAPFFIKWLQKSRLIITREGHYKHHSGNFDCNYCIFGNFNNWWMNRILK